MSFWKLQRNVKARMIERVMTHMINNCIFPFMGIYLASQFGKQLTGILMTATVFLAFAAGIFGGHLSDRIGRKALLVGTEILRFAAIAGMVVGSTAAVHSPALVYTGFFFCYFCSGLSGPAGDALIIDSSESEERRYIYSLDYWLWNISVLVGMIVGGFFFKLHRLELFVALGVVSLLSIGILVFFIRESRKSASPPESEERQGFLRSTAANYRTVVTNGVFLVFLAASLLDISIQLQFNNYTPIHLSDAVSETALFTVFGHTVSVDGYKLFSLLNIINTVAVVLLGTWIRKRTMKLKDNTVILGGLALYTLGYVFLISSTVPWLLIAMMVVVSFGELIYAPRKQAVLADLVPEDRRGSYMAVNALTLRGAMMIGALSVTLGGFIPPWAMGVELALMGLASLALYRRMFRLRRPASSDPSAAALSAAPPST
ncbi:MFS transporter [Gorillibacterium sp. sgz500922]|uniref:MFS transporter n=1 Tax=Gorillibacterium sp. sgz500922 TaxID=3446694 RepID=UPI003F66DA54